MGNFRKLTPVQIIAELESGTDLWVRDNYGYQTPDDSEKILRVEFYGNSLLGVGKYKARVHVLMDTVTGEGFYTLDVNHRLSVIGKSDFDSED